MFRVTIEIVPFGDETKKRTLYKIEGANIGTDAFDHADYEVTSESERGIVQLDIEDFDRKKGILKLVKEIIKKLIEKGERR